MPSRISSALVALLVSAGALSALPLSVVGFSPPAVAAVPSPGTSTAFVPSSSRRQPLAPPRPRPGGDGGGSRGSASTRAYSSPAETAGSSPLAPPEAAADDANDDDDEWEYVEFENLTEEDFLNSEWKVGTVWEDRPNNIKETWVRLIVQEGEGPGGSSRNVAVWGDGGKGRWSIDVPSQFFSVSKETFGGWGGKRIWAGQAEDYYYLQGTVRGWSPISPASVLGQWQMKRLGVTKEEAGVAPWFEEEEMTIQEIEEDVPKEDEKEG